MMSRVIVFDVNETLLDLRALDPWFQSALGDANVRGQWFSQLLQSALVSTVTDAYVDFGTIGRAALEMTAARHGKDIDEDERAALFGMMRSLPAHGEVKTALESLRDSGLRLATLTNSTEAFAMAQLESAGIAGYFDRVLSADSARRLKPAREAYENAARGLEVPIGDILMVAAHAWDIAGALRAGAGAAFVARPGMVLDPLAPQPEIVGRDLKAVAERILAVEGVS
jgi:2-haloacid dehalogenase